MSRKSVFWTAFIGASASAIVSTVFPIVREGILELVRSTWSGVAAVGNWFSATIPVSRGQCAVWFVFGFGLCAAIVMAAYRRRLAVARLPQNLDNEGKLVLDYIARRSHGSAYAIDRIAYNTQLSQVRTEDVILKLIRLGLLTNRNGGVHLTERGRKFAMDEGWV